MTSEVRNALGVLGYDVKWLEYGFIDAEILRQQMAIFDTGEDRSTEHYRYAAFCQVLDRDEMTDVDLDRYLGLVDNESDSAMAASVLFMLPVIILFFLAQKVFIEGITVTGVKG